MGLRKIEDEIDLKEALRKKAAEIKIKEIQAKASTENLTKERIADLAKSHGVILALTPELKREIKTLQQLYNIPTSRIITEEITENDVLTKSFKIDFEKLGLLAYQRVLMHKEETGGILPISDAFELVNTGILKGRVDVKDLIKALKILKKNNVIEDLNLLDNGVYEVHFFPVKYTGDEAKVITLAKEKGFLSLEDVCANLNWSQERSLKVLKTLETSGLAKFQESLLKGKVWYFPSA